MNKGAYLDVADRSWPVLRRVMGLHTFAYRATNGRIGRRIPGVPRRSCCSTTSARRAA